MSYNFNLNRFVTNKRHLSRQWVLMKRKCDVYKKASDCFVGYKAVKWVYLDKVMNWKLSHQAQWLIVTKKVSPTSIKVLLKLLLKKPLSGCHILLKQFFIKGKIFHHSTLPCDVQLDLCFKLKIFYESLVGRPSLDNESLTVPHGI